MSVKAGDPVYRVYSGYYDKPEVHRAMVAKVTEKFVTIADSTLAWGCRSRIALGEAYPTQDEAIAAWTKDVRGRAELLRNNATELDALAEKPVKRLP